MSTAIIRFEKPCFKSEGKDVDMVYCKADSYPCGLGFDLLDYFTDGKDTGLFSDKTRFEIVREIPKDIEYEYTVREDHTVDCQESWFAGRDYHGGGQRHGGRYNLRDLRKREDLIRKYTIRRPEDWNWEMK